MCSKKLGFIVLMVACILHYLKNIFIKKFNKYVYETPVFVTLDCAYFVNEFDDFSLIVKEINTLCPNGSISFEVPLAKQHYFINNSFDYSQFTQLGDPTNQFDQGICWAYASAELINRTRTRIIGSKSHPIEKIVGLLLVLYGFGGPNSEGDLNNLGMALKKACPSFRINCPKITEYTYGECTDKWYTCFWKKITFNEDWVKTKKVQEQVLEVLRAGRKVVGSFGFQNEVEWDRFRDLYKNCNPIQSKNFTGKREGSGHTVLIESYSDNEGETMLEFKNSWGLTNCERHYGSMSLSLFDKFFDGYFLEKDLTNDEKKSYEKRRGNS